MKENIYVALSYDQRSQFAQQMPQQYGADPNNPQGMAQGFHQMEQEQSAMLSQMFGQGGTSSNMMGQGGLGRLVEAVAQHMMSNRGGGGF